MKNVMLGVLFLITNFQLLGCGYFVHHNNDMPEGMMHGVIEILSEPTTAKIFQDGKYIGVTPLYLKIWHGEPKKTRLTAVPISQNQFVQHEVLNLPDIPSRLIFYMNQPDPKYLANKLDEPEIKLQNVEIPPLINSTVDSTTLLTQLFFSENNASIADIEKNKLLGIVKAISRKIISIEVRAYADADGSQKFNQQLSSKRAQAVEKFLIENGIEEKDIQIFSHGERVSILADGKLLDKKVDRVVDVLFNFEK